jgi:hypothetical protein
MYTAAPKAAARGWNTISGGAFRSGALAPTSGTPVQRKYGASAPNRPPLPKAAACSP